LYCAYDVQSILTTTRCEEPLQAGKTILALLLKEYIEKKEQRACVTYISSWNQVDVEKAGRWYDWIAGSDYEWPPKPGSQPVLIIDETQMSYWDLEFWNTFVKGITTDQNQRVILFASYGSPVVSPGSTPIVIPTFRQISLRPIDHGDRLPSAGLLLTWNEYMGLNIITEERFDQILIDAIYRISGGHVGAIRDLVDVRSRNSVGFISIYPFPYSRTPLGIQGLSYMEGNKLYQWEIHV
jgi:hypothetical protein